jgi:arylsulfatase A-like enzyme
MSMQTNLRRLVFSLMAGAGLLFPAVLPAQVKNVLLVIADDVGTDALALWNTNAGAQLPPTPNINALAQRGVVFRNAYSYPSCSPTRCAILTGRYGFRTGIGGAIADPGDPYLSPRDFTIAKALSANPQLGIRHAQIGKWHLSTNAMDPNFLGGWSHYSGFLAGERSSYYNWEKTVNGVTTISTNYATSDNATDAINWISAQGTNRWFLWFAPKAAHAPFEPPPQNLHTYSVTTNSTDPEKYRAMIQALDTELGRVFTNVNLAETMVVFLGDNGTPTEVVQTPYDSFHCKGTLFEGGVRVPMFFAGAGVVGSNRTSTAIVHAVDLSATMLEMMGVNVTNTRPTNLVFDSRSFAAVVRDEAWTPAEPVILMENFGGVIPVLLEGVAARGQRYKLVRLDSGLEAFFDLQTDAYETSNLLGLPNSVTNLTALQLQAYTGLATRLTNWHNPPVPPVITKWAASPGNFTVTVPEQLGITYELRRAAAVEATNWIVVPDFIRDVSTNTAEVRLSHASPPGTGFYRVTATGR